jgi:XFP N-terminal domain
MATVATERESLSAYGEARSTIEGSPLTPDELRRIDAYWRATLYLCLGMIYLKENPLLQEPLELDHRKARLLGHWGSDPGRGNYKTGSNFQIVARPRRPDAPWDPGAQAVIARSRAIPAASSEERIAPFPSRGRKDSRPSPEPRTDPTAS